MSSFISWLGNEFQGSICFFLLKDEMTILVYHVKVVFLFFIIPPPWTKPLLNTHNYGLWQVFCISKWSHQNFLFKVQSTFKIKTVTFDRRILPEYLYKLPSMPGLTSLNKSISHPNLVIHEYQDITNSSDIYVCVCVVFF